MSTPTSTSALGAEISAYQAEIDRRGRAGAALVAAGVALEAASDFFSLAVGAGSQEEADAAGVGLEAARAAYQAAKAEAAPRSVGPVPASKVEAALLAAKGDQVVAGAREARGERDAAEKIRRDQARKEAAQHRLRVAERKLRGLTANGQAGRGLGSMGRMAQERKLVEAELAQLRQELMAA